MADPSENNCCFLIQEKKKKKNLIAFQSRLDRPLYQVFYLFIYSFFFRGMELSTLRVLSTLQKQHCTISNTMQNNVFVSIAAKRKKYLYWATNPVVDIYKI